MRRLGWTLVLMGSCASPPPYLVNVVSQPSRIVEAPRTWALDRDACAQSGDPRLDDQALDAALVSALEVVFEQRDLATSVEAADLLVSYKLRVSGEGLESPMDDALRLSLRRADGTTHKFIWLAEPKTRVDLQSPGATLDGSRAEEAVRVLLDQYPPSYGAD